MTASLAKSKMCSFKGTQANSSKRSIGFTFRFLATIRQFTTKQLLALLSLSTQKGQGLWCHNARGRSDLEIHAGNIHWVFEFQYVKKDAAAPEKLREALGQIEKRQYGVENAEEKRIRVGLVYSAESKEIAAFEVLP